ncbi:GST N-terminal domain-containing protein [Pseudozyma hubeiensis]|nr:GST N-terminal domain-containing protein [Pseudozyma hubeiensis]
MEDASSAKRAGSAADTEEDFSTVPTTTAASESGFEDLAISETDSNVRVAASGDTAAASPSAVNEAVPAAASARTPAEPASHNRADSTSLSTSSSGLVLFDLTDKPNGTACFSPHTVKTLLDLKLLNVGYERQRLTFVQVRNDLASRIADNVTVPALELSDGSHIVDSWNIAEYLERRHPDGHKLFGDSATKRLAAMLNQFGKTVLAPHIGPLAQKGVHDMLDDESKSYFADVKIGKQRWAKVSNMGREERETHVQQAVAKLEVINAMLTCEGSDSTSGGGSASLLSASGGNGRSASRSRQPVWLAGGEQPTHADFVLFGWYVFTRAAGEKVAKEIWFAHKPIGRWVQAMLEWSGELAHDFV